MPTILITGGTGLIGRALTEQLLVKKYTVIILSRDGKNKEANKSISYAAWDVKKQTIDLKAVQAADFIIHLAGAGVVDKKWTAAYKKEIVESRTQSSKLLVETLKNNPHKIRAIVSASATGWYGEDNQQKNAFTETDKPASDFLGETCRLWEESISEAETLGIPVFKLRTGIVLSNHGGALDEFKKPLKFGVAAILGNGNQVISWIHIDDLCRMYIYPFENSLTPGSYNAVAPNPVSNHRLIICLAKNFRKSFIPMHVPAFMIKIMLGQRSAEVLKSVTVSSAKIKSQGFTFLYPAIESALLQLAEKKELSF